MKNIINKIKNIDKTSTKFIEDMIYPSENFYDKIARIRKEERIYGENYSKRFVAWMPSIYAYKNIKYVLKHPEMSRGEKIRRCIGAAAGEIILDVMKVGIIYGIYKFNKLLNSALR